MLLHTKVVREFRVAQQALRAQALLHDHLLQLGYRPAGQPGVYKRGSWLGSLSSRVTAWRSVASVDVRSRDIDSAVVSVTLEFVPAERREESRAYWEREVESFGLAAAGAADVGAVKASAGAVEAFWNTWAAGKIVGAVLGGAVTIGAALLIGKCS